VEAFYQTLVKKVWSKQVMVVADVACRHMGSSNQDTFSGTNSYAPPLTSAQNLLHSRPTVTSQLLLLYLQLQLPTLLLRLPTPKAAMVWYYIC
jgi:hypothetical protein